MTNDKLKLGLGNMMKLKDLEKKLKAVISARKKF